MRSEENLGTRVDPVSHFHSGTPSGKAVKIANNTVDGYLATASPEKAHNATAVLYIPDVWGIWQNSQLMADQFAANGYTTLVLDLFNGDPYKPGKSGDLFDWVNKGSDGNNPHTPEHIDPIILAGIKSLKEEHGAQKIGAVGYCFGAKYLIRHYGDGIDVGYVAHPSFVTDEELAATSGPLSIAAAETDSIFPAEKRHESEKILQGTKQPYQINLFSGVDHGFAVRGDVSKKLPKFAKEQAFLQAVAWFDNFLL